VLGPDQNLLSTIFFCQSEVEALAHVFAKGPSSSAVICFVRLSARSSASTTALAFSLDIHSGGDAFTAKLQTTSVSAGRIKLHLVFISEFALLTF
jgi:hypothetical protein